MKISLYLKTHNQTGLQYLGKTTQNPFKYKGSGSHWRKHIAKHGNDVTTTILFESVNNHDIKEMGEYYSTLWDVVDNPKFANIVPENGSGGNTSMSPLYKIGMNKRNTAGANNSMYGRSAIAEQNIRWYNNGIKNIYVPSGTEPEGFFPGRIIDYKKPHTNVTKEKIGLKNSKSCISPDGKIYKSATEAAKDHNISVAGMAQRCTKNILGWRWAT